ncbi:MAG: outer membrane protein transport protein [Gammaproteobacteria bacterium]|nr:outer membrane protein transport protein [Gammaproteobacteria bacterium]MDH5800760.1 outer membrane protein transport protein [Gammaproteobacteria bacterium]
MKKSHFKQVLPLGLMSLVLSPGLYATNGMNLEGYGPEAHAMGGASMAYDNGTAAVMNNPATLGFMEKSRLDVAFGFLGPNVTSNGADSSADAFYMPAIGYIQKNNNLFYGVTMFSQGGMGTEYDNAGFMTEGGPSSGKTVRSEVGVGRLIFPLAMRVNNQLSVAATLDYVWAGMDLQMDMSGAQFGDMTVVGSQSKGSVSGSLPTQLGGMEFVGILQGGNPVNWARFDFSDGSPFTGKAKGTGLAGKVGVMFQMNSQVSFGATYHTETSLGDMTSDNSTIMMSANIDDNYLNQTWDGGGTGTAAGTYTAVTIPLTGKISIKDFQWPAALGFGTQFKLNNIITLVADIKQVFWSSVMKNFNMTFNAGTQPGLAAGFSGGDLNAALKQEWDDQTVLQLGGAYQFNPDWVFRGGYNYASNPIPNEYLNQLFPATIEHHLTMGAGHKLDGSSSIDFSLAYALSNESAGVKHSQTNWQFLYTHMF